MQQHQIEKALLNLEEFCAYLGIGKTKARELLKDPISPFTIKNFTRLHEIVIQQTVSVKLSKHITITNKKLNITNHTACFIV